MARARAKRRRVTTRRRATKRRRATTRRKVADSLKQPVLIAVKIPASPSSDTAPARKLLDAIGRPPTRPPAKRRRRTKR